MGSEHENRGYGQRMTRGKHAVATTSTPMRSLRVPDETWDALKDMAARDGVTVSDVVRRGIALVLGEPHD